MPTTAELLRVLVAPLTVSAIIALIAYWRRWAWALPVAAGAGFVGGYALLGVPKLPPQDGNDWLFWLAGPLAILAAAAAVAPARWRWAVGVSAGAVALVITKPLVPGGVNWGAMAGFAVAAAVVGAAYVALATLIERRIPPAAIGLALSFALGAAAVVVMSSNLRIVGLYGIAAAAGVGTTALFSGLLPGKEGSACPTRYRTPATPGLAAIAAGLLAGLFAAGRFYPDPGVTWANLLVISLAPLLLGIGAALPVKRSGVRAAVGLILVAIALAAVTAPTAIAAKHAAEDDPYGSN